MPEDILWYFYYSSAEKGDAGKYGVCSFIDIGFLVKGSAILSHSLLQIAPGPEIVLVSGQASAIWDIISSLSYDEGERSFCL